jgi:hypothetical protein
MALELVRHGDARLDLHRLTRFLVAFQTARMSSSNALIRDGAGRQADAGWQTHRRIAQPLPEPVPDGAQTLSARSRPCLDTLSLGRYRQRAHGALGHRPQPLVAEEERPCDETGPIACGRHASCVLHCQRQHVAGGLRRPRLRHVA